MKHDDTGPATGESSTLEQQIRRLPEVTSDLGGADELRRDALVARAEARGMARYDAEQAYDIAREESLQPAWGLAVVLEGISVQPLGSSRPDVDAAEPSEPEWVDAPPNPRQAERERRLRQTFRRLRSRFAEEADIRAAIDALCADPDLEAYRY
jgi:hypothetical protein